MTDDLITLGAQLGKWPELDSGLRLSGSSRRLVDALEQLRTGSASALDVAALVRQVVRRHTVSSGAPQWVTVPTDPRWPARDQWHSHGMVLASETATHLALTAAPWHPKWMDSTYGLSPSEAAEGEVPRRPPNTAALGDGFLEDLLGVSTYTSVGQQQATRTVLASKPGATIFVNLPTGSGKSAVFVVPACIWASKSPGTTVVVVPTTALALDQERATKTALTTEHTIPLPDHLAFHSGLSKPERQMIIDGIRQGSQTIVFTSPESLTTSLAIALHDAAEGGRIHGFVIDEAHLVAQWGNDFRPEFQAAAGLRAEMLRSSTTGAGSVFRTILLTATLTGDAVDTLVSLYGTPGPIEFVSSVSLRPEPSYWFNRSPNNETRKLRLLEALRHLPRPLLLYTTKVEDANQWYAQLRSTGYRRVTLVTGDSTPSQRQRAIEGFTGRDVSTGNEIPTAVDLVVATSAFGLGIDQPDVRSVLHACVPETVDRFYQEVGRSGRDGNAATSLVLYTDADYQTAQGMNHTKLITADRAFERWQAMKNQALPMPKDDTCLRVPLAARPNDLEWNSKESEAWNVRTLTLMSRSGMIALVGEDPRSTLDTESSIHGVPIRLLDGNLADREQFDRKITAGRRKTRQADEQSWSLMSQLLTGDIDVAQVLGEAYHIEGAWGAEPLISVRPQPSCGGCPRCRRVGQLPYPGVMPWPSPVRVPMEFADATLSHLVGGTINKILLVTYDNETYPHETDWAHLAERVANASVRHGVRCLVAPEAFLRRPFVRDLHRRVPDRFLFFYDRYQPEWCPDIPTLIVSPWRAASSLLDAGWLEHAPGIPLRLALIPSNLHDPERPYEYASLMHRSISAQTLLADF